jgi:hypothetical protein
MKARVHIDAGICGFQTDALITSDDDQMVVFDVQSNCQKIQELGKLLKAQDAVDAYQEISPEREGTILKTIRSMSKACCAGCVVQTGLLKGMQLAAGLAVPKDAHVAIAKEEQDRLEARRRCYSCRHRSGCETGRMREQP